MESILEGGAQPRASKTGEPCVACGRMVVPCDLNPSALLSGSGCGIGFVHRSTGLHYCDDPPRHGTDPPRWAQPDPRT